MRGFLSSMMVIGMVGCSSASSDDPVKLMAAMTEEVCACKDKACTAAVTEKFRKDGERIKALKDGLSDEQKAAMKLNVTKLMGCMMKHAMSGMKLPAPKK
jgi:hypothetical protein